MASIRYRDVRITQIVGATEQPDSARGDVYIKDGSGVIIATAVETPASSGNYRASWTATNKYGKWYVGANVSYLEDIWLGEVDSRRPAHINIFRRVEVYDAADTPTGARGDAKTFVTGTSPLAADSDGTAAFAFFTVPIVAIAGKYQERGAFISTDPTLSGNNVTFGISVEDIGENYSDGKTYVDIIIHSRD